VFLSALKQDARPVALVLGNEEHGLSRATLAACEAVVTLAGEGAVQSLNVAATAAILLHALVSRHR
jgi:TrmH RNA methyltransferase